MKRKMTTFSSSLAVIICLFTFLFFGNQAVLADALPTPEIQALLAYPHWVGACGSGVSSNVTGGSGSSTGPSFPSLDPSSMASSINSFINSNNGNSTLKDLGDTIVASARNANVNPFLIVAIADEESSLGDPNDYNVKNANNSFGRKAAPGQPYSPGAGANAGTNWYKWSSVKASVDYMAPENQNTQGGGDQAAYLRYEFGAQIDSGDIDGIIQQYAPTSQNNTSKYISDVKGLMSTMSQDSGGTTSPSSSGTSCGCSSDSTNLIGSDNQEKIFNYFIGKGLTPFQSAGIDGNFGQESSWNPSDSGGYLAQWGGSRLTALQNFANQQGQPVTDLGVQLDYTWLELTNGQGSGEDDSKALADVKATTNATDAATVFMNDYERPGDPQLQNRIDYANSILAKYGNGSKVGSLTNSTCAGSVSCTNGSPSSPGNLSQTRQNIACIAQQELSLWKDGNMKPGFRADSSDSFSKYSENTDVLWCADFVSWVYKQASDPLQSSTWIVPAVQSIQSIGMQNGSFHWHTANSYTPIPGDLAIHNYPTGTHVNIVTAVSGNTITLIGGDQNAGPGGYPDASIVSQYTINGSAGDDIIGYVTPD